MLLSEASAHLSAQEDGGPDDALGSDWWRAEAILATPLRDLVKGLDSIGSFTIPYARLPRRLQAYAEEFRSWADLADQTPQSLLLRPKVGAAAVRALIDTANETVRVRRATLAAGKVGAEAAVARLVGQLDDFDRSILAAQVWALEPIPQRLVAERIGVHPASVGRNLPRARARFAELLQDPAHHEVSEHARELGRRLGPYLPTEVVEIELRRLRLEPSGQTARVLLHVAGPYARRGAWVEITSTVAGGRAQITAAVDALFAREPAPTTAALLEALTELGMPAGVALTYLESHTPIRRFGDHWVRWTGNTTSNMTEAALHVLGVPSTPEAILATINDAGTSLERVNAVLSKDHQFIRASRTTWALRTWGIPEYGGIVAAIGERLDATGGSATIKDVMTDVRARYPDITESSIRSYLGTLAFVTKGGVVRRRTKADSWPPVPPLNTVRGVFRNGRNEIRLAVLVASELLRGSGQSVHLAVAAAAGVKPGERRTFTGPHGQVALAWKLASTTGASLGSLRALAVAVNATAGDTLVLALRVDDATLDVARLGSEDSGTARLRTLLGRTVRNPVAALAASLDCQREEVATVLRARGDHDLASSLDSH